MTKWVDLWSKKKHSSFMKMLCWQRMKKFVTSFFCIVSFLLFLLAEFTKMLIFVLLNFKQCDGHFQTQNLRKPKPKSNIKYYFIKQLQNVKKKRTESCWADREMGKGAVVPIVPEPNADFWVYVIVGALVAALRFSRWFRSARLIIFIW